MNQLHVARRPAPTGQTFRFEKDADPGVRLTNFWPPEDGFVWSTGTWSEIAFPLRTAGEATGNAIAEVALDVDVFKAPPELEGQNVFFYVNGLRLASRFISGRVTVLLELANWQLNEAENIITIDTPDIASPSEHGQGDKRLLGVKVFSVTVRMA